MTEPSELTETPKPQSRTKQLEAMVRETPLSERLERCRVMIAQMCCHHRPPKMTIPVQFDDEDFFICLTLEDAIDALK